MSVVQQDTIDLVTILPGDPRVVLVAYDGGEVPDPPLREQALQGKLSSYLQFVISGQFARNYPKFLDRELCVLVVCTNPPSEGMSKIKGIRNHARPNTFIPVEVMTHADFEVLLKQLSVRG
jgi:hypothetical protein